MPTKRKKLLEQLRYPLRLVVINDETFEEKISFKLTPMNIFVALSSFLVVFVTIIILLVFYTPFRELVPGYSDTETKVRAIELENKVDSFKEALDAKHIFNENLKSILSGGSGLSDSIPLEK